MVKRPTFGPAGLAAIEILSQSPRYFYCLPQVQFGVQFRHLGRMLSERGPSVVQAELAADGRCHAVPQLVRMPVSQTVLGASAA